MNRQRKVLITTTYNELGIIIDTKAEKVAQPDLQPTCNQLATDCISRQAAIDAVAKAKVGAFPHDAGINNSIKAIKALPSAQPERKTGRWKLLYDNIWICTNCEQTEQFGVNIESTSDYCPNCGARMER